MLSIPAAKACHADHLSVNADAAVQAFQAIQAVSSVKNAAVEAPRPLMLCYTLPPFPTAFTCCDSS